jgi:uncharacterized protein YjbI with pentapeptide repeats
VNGEFVREDLAGARWGGRHLIRDTYDGCRMVGLEAPELVAEHVLFRRCRLELANFRYATLRSVVFDDCVLDEADFGGADLSLCTFAGCRMNGVRLAGVRLTKVDLRGNELVPDGDTHALKGATLDLGQLIDLAPLFARDLGIVTPDDVSSHHGDDTSPAS